MKTIMFQEIIGNIDDDLIVAADNAEVRKKPVTVKAVFAVAAACAALVCAAVVVPMFGRHSNQAYRERLYEVVAASSVMGDGVPSIASDVKLNTFSESFEDDSADRTRKYTLDGKEIELFYDYSVKNFGITKDRYENEEKTFAVSFKRGTDEIVNITRTGYIPSDDKKLSDEERLEIAVQFAKEHWASLGKYEYMTGRWGSKEEQHGNITISLKINGKKTTENCNVTVAEDGEITFFAKKMYYEDEIPDEVIRKAENIDIEICKKSIEVFLEKCSTNGKKYVLKGFGDYSIGIYSDGIVTCRLVTFYTANGTEMSYVYDVIIP